ncbi:unnamed protein product [Effrenium voratum]|nr:unnamed protein product [Effrenium voratum]
MSAAMDWPELPKFVREALESQFKTPLVLQASFESIEDAAEMLLLLLGDAANLDRLREWATVLNNWKESGVRAFKRQRSEQFASMQNLMKVHDDGGDVDLAEVFEENFRNSPSEVLALMKEQEKRRRKLKLDPQSHMEREEEASKDFEKQVSVLEDVAPLIDYVEERIWLGCGKSVPGDLQAALTILEDAGKRHGQVQGYIKRTISLSGYDWLKTGFDLWTGGEFTFPRDYFVMHPNADFTGIKKKYMKPADLANEIRSLLRDLVVRALVTGDPMAYDENEDLDNLVSAAGTYPLEVRDEAIAVDSEDPSSSKDIRDTMQKDFAIDAAADLQSRATVASVICAWESSKEYVTKETELKTEARVLGLSRVLQQSERRAMLSAVETAYGRQQDAEMPSAEYLAAKMEEAESNEPQASALDEITSAKDSQASSIQSVVDSSGHLRITKLKSKGKAPCTTEEYRNLLKIEANAWLAVASRHKAKAWLHGITPAVFEQFVAYILGDRVNLLEIPSGANADGHSNPVRPPWHIVLAYEHKLRREAMKLVNKDGQPLCEAMKSVIKDADLKEAFFTTPVAMYLADSGPNKWPRYNSKGSDSGFHGAGKGFKGRGKGKKGKMSKA